MLRKKFMSAALAVVMSFALSALGMAEPSAPVRLAGLKGPTSMGMVKLLSDNEAGKAKNAYDFVMNASGVELSQKLLAGEVDLAAVPSNLAAVLYNKTSGKIKVIAVNTLGVLYVVSTDESVKSLEDLKGKTIMATGKGQVPEITLRALLKAANIDPDKDVTIEFKSEPTEVVGLLAKDGGIAMLPQPFVTAASAKVNGLRVVLDLSQEWEKLQGSPVVTGVTVVRKDFLDANKDKVDEFLSEDKDSIEYVNANPDEASALIEKFGIIKAAIAKKALPKCNIHYADGEEMKKMLSCYFGVILKENPASLGGKLPDDEFYYAK